MERKVLGYDGRIMRMLTVISMATNPVNKHDIILLGSRLRIIVVIDMSAYNALSLKHTNYKNNLKPINRTN